MISVSGNYIEVIGGTFYDPITLADLATSLTSATWVATSRSSGYMVYTITGKNLRIGNDATDSTFFQFFTYDKLIMSTGVTAEIHNYSLNASGWDTYMTQQYGATRPVPTSLGKKAAKNIYKVICDPNEMYFACGSNQFVIDAPGSSGASGNGGGISGDLNILNKPKIRLIPKTSASL
jgi:hypothetical protein